MCALFRGSEDDWVKIGGDGQVRDRSQLSHVGDGQRCGAFKALKDAVVGVQGGKGAAALLFGVAGCGKTAMMARFVLERRAAIAKQVRCCLSPLLLSFSFCLFRGCAAHDD
jgi:hypothetical protein